MQLILDWIIWGLLTGIGRVIRRLFGFPPTASGIVETWIGAAIVLSVVIAVWYVMPR